MGPGRAAASAFHPALPGWLPLSSGEKACLRLLATLGSVPAPFNWLQLTSLDEQGQALVVDWCAALQAW